MNVAVSLAVADAFHQRGDGVAEVQRHGLACRVRGIGGGGLVRDFDLVRLGGLCQVDRGLRQRKEGLGQADQVSDLRRRRRLNDRLRDLPVRRLRKRGCTAAAR